MAKGQRILDASYIYNGKHYLPGPGGYGVVDLDGNEIDLPEDFPEEKLEKAKANIEVMEAREFRGYNRVPTVDSDRADGFAGKQPQDTRNKFAATDEDGGIGGDVEEGEEASGNSGGEDYESMTVEELAAMCDERGCEVKATGSAGKHVKKDYIKALKKADRAAE